MLVANEAPQVIAAVRLAYAVTWFTTPSIISPTALSFGYVLLVNPRRGSGEIMLPRYPALDYSDELFLFVGELHKARQLLPIE